MHRDNTGIPCYLNSHSSTLAFQNSETRFEFSHTTLGTQTVTIRNPGFSSLTIPCYQNSITNVSSQTQGPNSNTQEHVVTDCINLRIFV